MLWDRSSAERCPGERAEAAGQGRGGSCCRTHCSHHVAVAQARLARGADVPSGLAEGFALTADRAAGDVRVARDARSAPD